MRKYPSVWGCFQTSLAGQTQLTRMQSFNQIAHSGDKWEERDKEFKKRKGTLNLWLTESCEGTLKSPPKSFKLGHVALAFVTFMLRNVAEWKSGRKFYKKNVTTVGKKMALMDVMNDRTPGTQILIWWLFAPTKKGGGGVTDDGGNTGTNVLDHLKWSLQVKLKEKKQSRHAERQSCHFHFEPCGRKRIRNQQDLSVLTEAFLNPGMCLCCWVKPNLNLN